MPKRRSLWPFTWLPRPSTKRPRELACRSQACDASTVGLRGNATATDGVSSTRSVASAAIASGANTSWPNSTVITASKPAASASRAACAVAFQSCIGRRVKTRMRFLCCFQFVRHTAPDQLSRARLTHSISCCRPRIHRSRNKSHALCRLPCKRSLLVLCMLILAWPQLVARRSGRHALGPDRREGRRSRQAVEPEAEGRPAWLRRGDRHPQCRCRKGLCDHGQHAAPEPELCMSSPRTPRDRTVEFSNGKRSAGITVTNLGNTVVADAGGVRDRVRTGIGHVADRRGDPAGVPGNEGDVQRAVDPSCRDRSRHDGHHRSISSAADP